jgi:hypothetical protein
LFSIADDPSMDEELPPEALRALERARSADKRPLLVPLLVGGALLVVIVILIALLLTGDRQADPSGTIYPSVGPAGATPSPRIARTALTSISTPPGGI